MMHCTTVPSLVQYRTVQQSCHHHHCIYRIVQREPQSPAIPPVKLQFAYLAVGVAVGCWLAVTCDEKEGSEEEHGGVALSALLCNCV